METIAVESSVWSTLQDAKTVYNCDNIESIRAFTGSVIFFTFSWSKL